MGLVVEVEPVDDATMVNFVICDFEGGREACYCCARLL